jgi:two-component system phosphate regulon response regulator PhoB
MKQRVGAGARRVLVIEDEPDLRELLIYNFQESGYEVRSASGGEEGLRLFEDFRPHVVLLDLMLSDIQGTEVCRRIRSEPNRHQPAIVMLTAKGDEIDRVVGFELGADDYVTKPFSMRELLLRVGTTFKGHRAQYGEIMAEREDPPAPPSGVRRRLVAGPLSVDVDGHHVFVSGQEVHVSILEMRLLVYLMESRGHVRSREDLLSDVWGYKPGVSTRTVDTHVKRLRDKLGDAGLLIETVRGMGYRFAEPPKTEATRA